MTKTGVLIELDLLCDQPLVGVTDAAAVLQAATLKEDSAAQLQRLNKAGVGIVIVSQLQLGCVESWLADMAASHEMQPLAYLGLSADSPASWQWPKPAQLLRACTENDLDIFNSWVIGHNHNIFNAASQAGLLGGIYIGDAMPVDTCGLQVLNQARSLADAPRVMIPPKGGCWHDHG